MKDFFNYFPANLVFSIGISLAIMVLILIVILPDVRFSIYVKKNTRVIFEIAIEKTLLMKLIGSLSIVCLAIASNNSFVYFLSIILIATLITELEFIERVAAILTKNSDYFESKNKEIEKGLASQADALKSEETKVTKELKSDISKLEVERSNYAAWFHFEKMYRLIFASQLEFLKSIASNGDNGFDKLLTENWYNNTIWVGRYPYVNYFGFLTNNLLLEYKVDLSKYFITPLGREFLVYLSNNQMPSKTLDDIKRTS